jgi:hypothetical protein
MMEAGLEQALRDLWFAVRTEQQLVLNPEAGIYKYWLEHRKELGSPVGPEHVDGELVFQAFTNGIVKWTPNGPEAL